MPAIPDMGNLKSMNASDNLIIDPDGLRISKAIASIVVPGSSILDIGCGNRMLYDAVCGKANNCYYMGLDIDRSTIRKLHQSIEDQPGSCRCDFSNMNVSNVPPLSFDYCICSRLFHHFDETTALYYLTQMVQITKNGVFLIIVDYVRDYSCRKDHFLYLPDFFITALQCGKKEIEKVSGGTSKPLSLEKGCIWMLAARKNRTSWQFSLTSV